MDVPFYRIRENFYSVRNEAAAKARGVKRVCTPRRRDVAAPLPPPGEADTGNDFVPAVPYDGSNPVGAPK